MAGELLTEVFSSLPPSISDSFPRLHERLEVESLPTLPTTKTAQLSQLELGSVWQSRIAGEEAEERGEV